MRMHEADDGRAANDHPCIKELYRKVGYNQRGWYIPRSI